MRSRRSRSDSPPRPSGTEPDADRALATCVPATAARPFHRPQVDRAARSGEHRAKPGESSIGLEDLQLSPEQRDDSEAVEEAIAAQLADGPRPSREVKAAVIEEQSCSARTVKRAAQRMRERDEVEGHRERLSAHDDVGARSRVTPSGATFPFHPVARLRIPDEYRRFGASDAQWGQWGQSPCAREPQRSRGDRGWPVRRLDALPPASRPRTKTRRATGVSRIVFACSRADTFTAVAAVAAPLLGAPGRISRRHRPLNTRTRPRHGQRPAPQKDHRP
jgi:hypothetical protein